MFIFLYVSQCMLYISFLSLSPFFSSSTHLAHPPISTRFSILHSFPLLPFRSFFSFFFFFFFFSRFARRVYIVYVCLILRWTEPLVSSRDPYLIRNSLLQRLLQLSFSRSFPRLFSYSPFLIGSSKKKKKKRKASRHYYNNERRQNATRILFEDESRISIRLFRRGHPIRSMITKIKIRKIIQRRELSLSLSLFLSLEARSKIVPFLFFFFFSI